MEQNANYVYTLKQSSQFKKDLKAVKFDEHKLDELQKVLEHLGHTGVVPAEYFTDQEYDSLKADNDELLKLLTSTIKKTKENGIAEKN